MMQLWVALGLNRCIAAKQEGKPDGFPSHFNALLLTKELYQLSSTLVSGSSSSQA